jgi:FdhE protein
MEVAPALVEYVVDTALSFALQRAREEGLSASTEGWHQGYCPLCGGVPSMGELTGDESRRLHCSVCATAWSFPRLRCAACGNTDPDALEYFTAEGETAHRVDVCRSCSSYLKTVDSREAGENLPMDIEDVSTLHLDLLAQKEGFARGKR